MQLQNSCAVETSRFEDRDALDLVRQQWERSFAKARRAATGDAADPDYCRKLERLVLILSASRSGSSWLADTCSYSPQFSSLTGEIDPFLLLALGRPDVVHGESDRLHAHHATRSVMEALSLQFSWLAGHRSERAQPSLSPRQLFVIEARTLLQWPELHECPYRVRHAIRAAFGESQGRLTSEDRMISYLKRLKEITPRLNPYYYDLEYDRIAWEFTPERLPVGPPHERDIIEEPPFVCVSPWIPTPSGELAERPLVMKSPSNAYRLDFLRALFPNARITVVHVVRDTAASVTGMMFGWLHHGFFKHYVRPGALDIEGYTRADRPWTSSWWKFDLPPRSADFTRRPLDEVCRFQWVSANEEILRWVSKNRGEIDYIQTLHETRVGDPQRETHRVFEAMGLSTDQGVLDAITRNRAIMVSRGVSKEQRAECTQRAAIAADCAQVRQVRAALEDARRALC